jgi:methionyl-tRNA synthetase
MNSIKLGSFVTSPIFYVNGPPHLGHLYTVVLCDALHRYLKLKAPDIEKRDSKFSTGTDEHGLKVVQASLNAVPSEHDDNTTKSYCDRISTQFASLMKTYNISCTDYTRTTDLKHVDAVCAFWVKNYKKQI